MSFGKAFSRKKTLILAICAVICLSAAVYSTAAYIIDRTNPLINIFDPASVACEVYEDFDNEVKENVRIHNTGDIDAYIRAAYIVTWQDNGGNVFWRAPVENTDYTVTMGTDTNWSQGSDGYWYYDISVSADDSDVSDYGDCTAVWISRIAPVSGRTPAGYSFCVEIVAQAVQAIPSDVVTQVWGYTPKSSQ